MSVPKPALACTVAAGVIASSAVANQRIGLALSVALVLVVAAGTLAAAERASPTITVLAVALALQPALRDAGWVVAWDVTAALIAAALAVSGRDTWRQLGRALIVPFRLLAGMTLVARAARTLAPLVANRHAGPILRGVALALALVLIFGGLFVAADKAFAELVDQTLSFDVDAGEIVWRLLLGLGVAAAAGAVARAAAQSGEACERPHARVPGPIELRIGLSAIVALFATFVSVQLHVLFGGAGYVQKTTGLGYGEYARQGFVQLLVVAALTLGIVAVAARRRDRAVRGLLGALCLLTLVVLISAHHRLVLVEDAYGLTRVRYAGHAIVVWFAAMFGLVLVAGSWSKVARRGPHVAATLTLGGVLVFSLSNPDGRIADSAVSRAAAGRPLDTAYIEGLSADALPALERLPEPERDNVVAAVRARLSRPDGIAGANLSRARAR
jgi:hypothetical protein